MSLRDFYANLLERSCNCLTDLSQDQDVFPAFTRAHSFSLDFEAILKAIEDRPESELFRLASREYEFALYALAIGSNRHAHNSLRLFLELTLGAVYFSAYEIKLRHWLANSGDISWGAVTSSDDGIFSPSFISAFNSDFHEYSGQYSGIASAVYRECSEFVHGNLHTSSRIETIAYKKEFAQEWIDRAESARLVVLFAFACRYLKFMGPLELQKLEAIMLESLGHLQAVQACYN
jgi:hypothetical protein